MTSHRTLEPSLAPPHPTPAWIRLPLLAAALTATAALITVGVVQYSYKTPMAVVGLAMGALIFWNPFVGLVVVVMSLPFETSGMLGDPDATGSISITKISGVATMASVVVHLLLKRPPLDLSRLFNRRALLVALYAGLTVTAAIVHPSKESFKESIRIVTILAFFAITLLLVNSPLRLRRVVLAWVTVGTLVSAYSLLQRQFGSTVGSEDWTPSAGTIVDVSEEDVGVMVRAAGTFTHPSWLALYLTITLPMTFYFLWTVRTALRKAWCLAAIALQSAAVLITYSRMGYLGLAVGAGLFLLRRRGGPIIILWTVIFAAATSPLWPGTIMSRIESILDYTKSSSSVTRIGQQLVGLWMFRDHPVIGVGPGNFEETVRLYVDRVPDKWRIEVIGAHNLYVEVLAELGAGGLLVILLILFSAWRAAERSRRLSRDRSTVLLYEALSASLLVFAFSAVLLHAQYQKEWWLLLALIVSGEWIAQREAAARQSID